MEGASHLGAQSVEGQNGVCSTHLTRILCLKIKKDADFFFVRVFFRSDQFTPVLRSSGALRECNAADQKDRGW